MPAWYIFFSERKSVMGPDGSRFILSDEKTLIIGIIICACLTAVRLFYGCAEAAADELGEGRIKSYEDDSGGKFKINVPKGNFEIKVSYMGMLTQTISSKEKALKNLKIFLEEDSHTIQDVVVTGT